MPDSAVYDAVADGLRNGFQRYRRLPNPTEADIRHLVISPVLTAIGYSDYYRRPEQGAGRNRPDEICYVAESPNDAGPAALIVEAKSYNTNFDRAPGGLSSGSPDRQIQRYLRQHPASGPNTVGVLTDGLRWRVYERTGPAGIDVRFRNEYNFAGIAGIERAPAMLPAADRADDLQGFVDLLCRECVLEQHGKPRRPPKPGLADGFLAVFGSGAPTPDAVLPHLLGGRMAETHNDLSEHVILDGIRQDAHEYDWNAYAYALGAPLQSGMPTLEGRRVVTAAVRFSDESNGLSRADTALCARTFARVLGADASVVLAYRINAGSEIEARLAACAGGATAMTAPFDPDLPTASAKTAVEDVLGMLAVEPDALAPERLLVPLEVAPLRQQFYKEVSDWTKRLAAGRGPVEREAVLRHLIRVMFAWILKEDGLIPAELFERGFASAVLRDLNRYHATILRFLFHDRLNVEEAKREQHSDRAIDAVMEEAPFLNGSLFQEQEGDNELDIPAAAYWDTDAQTPGLFTVFSRYHWTTDEHRPGESEQTLDPELLSNLFERLILPIESDEQLDRQPRGTYYTPADVTAEMVKDALAAAARSHAPASVTDEQLLDLFGDRAAPLPEMSGKEGAALAERIRALRIFDPAVGSGAFLFGCLVALKTALEKLEPDSAEPTPGIIREQLHGQDIHPLAAQITRLRLFIALKAADRDAGRDAPLPNLEARIVCADTLETSADSAWRPDHPGQLDTADPELVNALLSVAENRAAWMDAHTEEEKQRVLGEDRDRRDSLRLLLDRMGDLASPELRNFAETPILPLPSHPAQAKVARTDARLLFYENPWRGFDVVIGNPPYEALSESMDASRRKSLAERKRYRTTNCGDLYTLFCEAALALAKPESGVVTMIVPLSIAFGQRQRTLRSVFTSGCSYVNPHHYDTIPDTAFNGTPTLKTWKNRQRATILTAVTGAAKPAASIRTTGLQRWGAGERERVIPHRGGELLPSLKEIDVRMSGQWPRIPTPEIAAMVKTILVQKRNVASYSATQGEELAIPQTTGYFIAVIPPGSVTPRRETVMTVADAGALRLVVAAVNGHVGYGWWRVYGDGFDVNGYEVTTLAIPDAWVTDPQPAIDLGQRLIDAIPRCVVQKLNAGIYWRNVDFHTYAPDLIAEIDRLYIEALGLPVEPLLTHLKIMRSNRSWDFGTAARA